MIPSIIQKVIQQDIFSIKNHPLTITKDIFVNSFITSSSISNFNIFHDKNYVVNVKDNFDDLLFEKDHIARSTSDTYYLEGDSLLRTHLTAREKFYISSGIKSFLLFGKVFRKDAIDKTHFPVFHQLEGVKLFDILDFPQMQEKFEEFSDPPTNFILNDLQDSFKQTFARIFGEKASIRFPSAIFPFTHPSFEVEVFFRDNWLEILGAGMLQKKFLDTCFSNENHLKSGWAFGIGLERIAMILFDIPDIRWFWSKDERFLSQFQEGKVSRFLPFSNHPPIIRDLSFWIDDLNQFCDTDIYDLIRAQGCDSVESVQLVRI